MLVRKLQNYVLESILGFALDGQDVAEMIDVMLPKDHVLSRFYSVKDGLHRDHGFALMPHALYEGN
jgi:hypothetical protein